MSRDPYDPLMNIDAILQQWTYPLERIADALERIASALDPPGDPTPVDPPPVEHRRVGAARCSCGYDAYVVGASMLFPDYHAMFMNHLTSVRT